MVELFTTIGKVERAEIQYEPNGRSRGTGVVEFDTAGNAETAICKFLYLFAEVHLLIQDTAKFTGYKYGGRPLGLSFVKYNNAERVSIWQRLANIPISVDELTNVDISDTSPYLRHSWLVLAWEVPKIISKARPSVNSLLTGSATMPQYIDISNAIVVSGASNIYEASTTSDHLRKHWGSVGTDVLDAIQDALAHMSEVRGKISFPQNFV